MKRLATIVAACGAVAAAPVDSAAEPKIVVKMKYYPIAGSTSRELKNQMKRKGPGGYWAYTGWYVRWSGGCQVTVTISYEYPKWTNRGQAPAELRAKWDSMFSALERHEQQHGQHGVNAAKEIDSTGCSGNPQAITNKWANQDKVFDAQTNHGRNQGVVLP